MTDGTFRPAPPNPEEAAKVNQVLEILVGVCDGEQVLNALRRNYGNVEKTIAALLDDPTSGSVPVPTMDEMSALRDAAAAVVQPQGPPPSQPVIDLTGDGDAESEDLQRAMAASLQDTVPILQPSTRAPDPNWAMVSSNAAVTGLSQDEQDMNQAIELSLQDELSLDQFEEKPLEERLRKGDAPVTLRAAKVTQVYAAITMHALYAVPQVRQAIAKYMPTPPTEEDVLMDADINLEPPEDGPAHLVWSLVETFVYLDLARLSELSADQLLSKLPVDPWTSAQSPGDLAYAFYDKVAFAIESVLHGNLATDPCYPDWPRLFYFRHGSSNRAPNLGPFDLNVDSCIAKVLISGLPGCNDLVSCLAEELKAVAATESQPQVIVRPSEVVAFQLLRHHSSSDRQRFTYPAYFYLDQFMHEKMALANEKRQVKRGLLQRIADLEARKKTLTRFQDRDALVDLRSAAYYYENIAEDNEDDMRRSALQDTAAQLHKIISQIEAELQYIDTTMAQCKIEAEEVLNCPGLQDYKYELRAVLMHDGFYGRNHMYSYVKHKGVWWKTVEFTITEVTEEEVLEDSTGLHLNAGPFLTIYSRAQPPEEENARLPWQEDLKNNVKRDNHTLFETVGPEAVAGFEDPNSPLTGPLSLSIDTETSSMEVEPPSRGDEMELDVESLSHNL